MKALPTTLYTAEQTRLLDQTAILQAGIPGFTLMQRAGRAVFAQIRRRWPDVKQITLLCGGGNNGGDGLVIAALAHQRGWDVQARFIGDDEFAAGLTGEARDAWLMAEDAGVELLPFDPTEPMTGELIVDAMLGTGLSGVVRGEFAEAINKVNRQGKPVVAVDIPSGICADTGRVLGSAVKAELTVTFIGLKQGLLMHDAVEYVGDLHFDSLNVPDFVYEQVSVNAFRVTDEDIAECLPKRARAAHKGCFGHVLVVGGDHGFGGAALMAAEAALVAGAGKVSLATRAEHVSAALIRNPEIMVKAVEAGHELSPLLDEASVVVLGPGLGQHAWGEQMLQQVWQSDVPVVLDADGLNLLVAKGLWGSRLRRNWVITPHPGEAARLLDMPVDLVQQDRIESLFALQNMLGGTVVLKGAGSLISDGDVLYVCNAGNPGMASGGMGDVLAGVIGALMAQKLNPVDASRIAVYAHAHAADLRVAEMGERGLKATELMPNIRLILNGKYVNV